MKTAEEVLREALVQYADTANWMPTHINTETGDIVHLFWCAVERKSGENGWTVAEEALKEAENYDLGSLQKVAVLMQEYLSIGPTTQSNVWRKSNLYERLMDAMSSAGYPVGGPRPL